MVWSEVVQRVTVQGSVGVAGGGDLPGLPEAGSGPEQDAVPGLNVVPQDRADGVLQGGCVGAQHLAEFVAFYFRPRLR